MMDGAAQWTHARNILCVRLDNMGDVLMSTPAMRAIKESAPGRRLTLLASPACTPLVRHIPEIDDVMPFDAPWVKSGRPPSAGGLEACIAALAARAFDAAVVFTVYSQSALPAALLLFQAGIPRRLAYCRENPYHLLTQWAQEEEPARRVRHEVRRQLDLVALAGCTTRDERLSFRIDEADTRGADEALRAAGVSCGGGYFIVHPGASAPSRRYPADQFGRAAALIAAATRLQPVIAGGPGEAAQVQAVREHAGPGAVTLPAGLRLGPFAAVVRKAVLLVANNSGPAHVAAAVGTPVVDLYALTNPQHTPWQVPSRVLYHDVPCRYCYKSVCPQQHHDCLRRVAPEAVARAAVELLDELRGAAPARRKVAAQGDVCHV